MKMHRSFQKKRKIELQSKDAMLDTVKDIYKMYDAPIAIRIERFAS